MADLSCDKALIDWRITEENRKVFQKLLEDLDHLLQSLRARMNGSAGDEDGKASAPPSPGDGEGCLLEGQDAPDKKAPFRPECSPGSSSGNPAQERCEADQEDGNPEEDLQTQCEESEELRKVKRGQWPPSESKEEPESAQFLLRWPPEGSVFVRSGGAEPHHSCKINKDEDY